MIESAPRKSFQRSAMLTLSDFEHALAIPVRGPIREQPVRGISIDSRTLERGDVFFAIRGQRLDGHDFLREAKDKGACAFVIEKRFTSKVRSIVSENVLEVDDTTIAFGKLAKYYRQKHNLKALAVTGSCGKTTTRQMAHSLLSRKYGVLASDGNLNNQFGLPLTIFRLHRGHQVLLAELGASRPHDVAYLAEILAPEIGLITNVYPAHLEGFGSLEKVYETKLELADYLEKMGGTLIVNGDFKELKQRAQDFRVKMITFGRDRDNDFFISSLNVDHDHTEFEINERYQFRVRTHALFNVDNFLAGIVLAHEAGVSWNVLEGAIDDFQPLSGRFELVTLPQDISVIHDAYNANPGSMIQSLASFAAWDDLGKRKIAILSDMRELGSESGKLHRRVGREMKPLHIPILVTIGDQAAEIAKGASESGSCKEIYSFADHQEALLFLFSLIRPGDALFLKGSRAMKLEELLDALKSELSKESTGVS